MQLLAGKLPMEMLQPIATVQQVVPLERPIKQGKPGVEQLLAPVESCLKEAQKLSSQETREAVEASLRMLLLGFSKNWAKLPETEKEQLDQRLVAVAPNLKTALLRPLNTCAAYQGYASLPATVEQTRRSLALTPAKGGAALLELLMQDIDVCKDGGALECVGEVLAFLVGEKGRLRSNVGATFDESIKLPAAHQEACRAALVRLKKRQEALRAWRRSQMEKSLSGLACVRYERGNEVVDIVDRRDDKGYTLDLQTVRVCLVPMPASYIPSPISHPTQPQPHPIPPHHIATHRPNFNPPHPIPPHPTPPHPTAPPPSSHPTPTPRSCLCICLCVCTYACLAHLYTPDLQTMRVLCTHASAGRACGSLALLRLFINPSHPHVGSSKSYSTCRTITRGQ